MIDSPEFGRAGLPARQLLRAVLADGPSPRSELARRLGLSPASLTRLAARLLGDGLLRELDSRHLRRSGRPARPLDVVEESRLFVGIKLTDNDAYGVLTGLRAGVLSHARRPIDDHGPSAVASVIGELCRSLSDRATASEPEMIGISLGGQVRDHRIIRYAPFLGWEDVDLGHVVEAALSRPVVIDNDVIALTKGLHWTGEPATRDRLAVITTGAGVGYGLIMHGRVVESPDAGVGLLGHYPLDRRGPRCSEGHRGCAAALLTTDAIENQTSTVLRRQVDLSEVFSLAQEGNPQVSLIIKDAAEALGRLIGAVSSITMTGRVVVTGETAPVAVIADDALKRGMADARNSRSDPVHIDLVEHNFLTWAQGAAVTAIHHWLDEQVHLA